MFNIVITMTIKNIIFDFGAVVMDWNPEYLYKKIFKDETERNYFLTEICHLDWNYQFDKGKPFQEGIDELKAKFPKYSKEIQLYKDRWIEMIKGEIVENSSLVPVLSKKYNLYGLTNWSAETFAIVYEKYDFFKIFKGIVVSGKEKVIKPDPAIFKILLSRYNLKAEESLFIDDNKKNTNAAEKLKFHTIHYTEDMNLRNELLKRNIEL